MQIRVSSADEDKRTDIILRLRKYRAKVQEYQACKELYDSLFPSGTHQLTDMPRAQSDVYEPERWTYRRLDQSERMQKSLNQMLDALDDIEKLTDLVEGEQRTVLVRRYLMNESWETISMKLHCERTTVWRWHNKAIDMIAKSCNTMQQTNGL